MNPVVSVIAPGMMGAAVGGRLAAHGLRVLTSLTGRSEETKSRKFRVDEGLAGWVFQNGQSTLVSNASDVVWENADE